MARAVARGGIYWGARSHPQVIAEAARGFKHCQKRTLTAEKALSIMDIQIPTSRLGGPGGGVNDVSDIAFGKYLLLERVNIGGMAEVYKAKAFGVEGFERILAIKRILPNMADDDEFINMFVDEARIAVQLSHANIVQIYELGKFESQYYIAMEYVSGKDLRQILDRFRKNNELLPLPAAAFLASKICDGLDYAHQKADPSGRPMHVIHRDVSPQNILVSYEGAVKITDFGIAKAEDRGLQNPGRRAQGQVRLHVPRASTRFGDRQSFGHFCGGHSAVRDVDRQTSFYR